MFVDGNVDAPLFCLYIFCLSLLFKSPLMFGGPPITRGSVNSVEGSLKVFSWGITYFLITRLIFASSMRCCS